MMGIFMHEIVVLTLFAYHFTVFGCSHNWVANITGTNDLVSEVLGLESKLAFLKQRSK